MAARRKAEPAPPQLLETLRRELASGEPRRGYVLRGEELYFREQAIDLLRARASELGWEVATHDAVRGNPDFSLARLTDDLSGSGLFSAQRLVVVRNPAEPLKKSGRDDSSLTRVLKSFLADPGRPGTVVLSANALRADHAAVKAVVAADGMVFDSRKLWDSPPPWGDPDPTRAELVMWLLSRARDLGVRLQPGQAVYVCAATGNDLAALEDQLGRLAASSGAELRDVVAWEAAGSPWAAAESLLDGDLPRTLSRLETLFRGGTVDRTGRRLLDGSALVLMLVGSLVRGTRQALTVATALADGRSDAQAVGDLGMKPTQLPAKAALARARSRPAAAWRRRFDDACALEVAAKSSTTVDHSTLPEVALRWCGSAAAPAGGRK
jgi:DNA polymerase III delta subunit